MIDAGAPENRTIIHTGIHEITCTPSELSKVSQPIYKKVKEVCENEAGCSGDFNTYDTMEMAKAALERWLKPYITNTAYAIKTINP